MVQLKEESKAKDLWAVRPSEHVMWWAGVVGHSASCLKPSSNPNNVRRQQLQCCVCVTSTLRFSSALKHMYMCLFLMSKYEYLYEKCLFVLCALIQNGLSNIGICMKNTDLYALIWHGLYDYLALAEWNCFWVPYSHCLVISVKRDLDSPAAKGVL